jgi:basic amino acid/polyamine antiporter, APA family
MPSASLSEATEEKKLKRKLGFWDSVAINVGVIIGVGIFRTPGAIAQHLDTIPLILLTWILGGLVALLGVFCYCELSTYHPQTGGTYVYLREAFGKRVGFLFGWTEFAILRAGSVAGVAYILTNYVQHFLPFPDSYEKLVVILSIWIFTLINIAGIELGAGVQNLLTSLKIIAILGMAVIIFSLKGIPIPGKETFSSIAQGNWMGIAPALIPVLWTYGGWHQSTFMSGEFRDPRKDLPRSLIMGIFIVTAVYVLINAAYLQVLTPAETTGTKAIASDIFARLFGPSAQLLVSLAIVISASGALNSTILTGGRIPFAVAQDSPRLSWFAKIDDRFKTPLRSLVLNGAWASILVLWGNFDQLLFFFAFANWLFFALVGVSVFVLRNRLPHAEKFKAIGYPAVPAFFILSCIALCWITIVAAPKESLFGAILLLSGIPLYQLFKGKTSMSS